MLLDFVRAYPGRSSLALTGVFLASLFEGLGMSMVLAMLSTMNGDAASGPSAPQRLATWIVNGLGIPPKPGFMLVLAVFLIAMRGVMSLLANRQLGYTVARIATDMRLRLIRATMGARWRHYLEQSVGGLSNAIATEAQRASEAFQFGAEMSAMVLSSLVYLTVAFAISWQAGLAAAVAGTLMLLAMRVLIRASRQAGERQTDLQKSLLALIGAQFSAAKPLKAMAREDHVDALLTDQTQELESALRRQVIAKEALTALQEPMLAILVITGFYLGGTFLSLPFPELLVLLFMLARVLSYLSRGQRAYQQVVVRESAYWSLIDGIAAAHDQREPPGGGAHVHLRAQIFLDQVRYSHDGRRNILDGVSLTVPARGLTLIIGPSGSGKTTLLDLVVGLRHPDGGRIRIDDIPLEQMDMRYWRRQIGYVPQESVMADESVAHNLTLGEDIPEQRIRDALRAADALDFVDAMPEGIRTRVGQGGSRLSGGQRQRLAIARALIHEPKLLILDEATSNLDPEAQDAIVETVSHLKARMAVLAVAHQEKLARVADQVLRLADGRLEQLSLADGRDALGS